LVIIRHGEAECNVGEYIGGHASCRGLTERGRRQAGALAERLARTGELAQASAFYTSVLPRAIETSEIIAPVLAGKAFIQRCDLCERHPGEADGLTWAQYNEKYLRRSLPGDDPYRALAPGGESWSEFLDRAAGSLTEIAAAHPGELIVIAAHGGIIDASMIRLLELADHGNGVRLHPEHTSLTEWQHVGTKWRLVRYSDAAHLLGLTGAPGEHEGLHSEPPSWVIAEPAQQE
jgi:probable phosphoglycerate mutase